MQMRQPLRDQTAQQELATCPSGCLLLPGSGKAPFAPAQMTLAVHLVCDTSAGLACSHLPSVTGILQIHLVNSCLSLHFRDPIPLLNFQKNSHKKERAWIFTWALCSAPQYCFLICLTQALGRLGLDALCHVLVCVGWYTFLIMRGGQQVSLGLQLSWHVPTVIPGRAWDSREVFASTGHTSGYVQKRK